MTTTFANQAGPGATSDPTAVMGKRILAWVLDLIVYVAVVGGLLAVLAEYKDIDEGFDGDEVEFCEDLLDANPDFDGTCISPPFGDRVYLIETSDSLAQSGAALGWGIINFVLISGVAGGSVGKLLSGLRVVDRQGRRAGIGKHIVRLLLWIIDGIPGLPVVGGIAAMTSNGHRRVGDMVAGTHVVARRSVGTPIAATAAPVPPGVQPWGAAPTAAPPPTPQPWGQQPPTPSPPSWEPPAAPESAEADLDAGGGSESDEGGDAHEIDPTATMAGAHAPWTPPTSEPQPPTAQPESPSAAPEAAPASQALPEPQWDAARNTYLQWDPNRNAWLQWDAAANAWKPIDT